MALIFSIIIGCFSIGVLLSAPMGPIGILCVQRTLSRGRKVGLYTGIGAAISDLFYCLLTGLGMSIVTDWIETNQYLLQVIGSVLLMAYAIVMIVRKPKAMTKSIEEKKDNPVEEIMTGFLLTLTNPLIVFLIIPLFARFSFPMPEYSWLLILLGYVMIVAGALAWWWVITYSVDKVRSSFDLFDSMRKINVVMGSLLLILSIYGLVMGMVEYMKFLGVIV